MMLRPNLIKASIVHGQVVLDQPLDAAAVGKQRAVVFLLEPDESLHDFNERRVKLQARRTLLAHRRRDSVNFGT